MIIALANRAGTAELLLEEHRITIRDAAGETVATSAAELHAAMTFGRAGSFFLSLKRAKQLYQVSEQDFHAVVDVFGGPALVEAEITTVFHGSLWMPAAMFALVAMSYLSRGQLGMIDQLMLAGSIAHFALTMYGRSHHTVGVYQAMILFNLYYLVVWILIGLRQGFGLAGFMIALMGFLFWVGWSRLGLFKELIDRHERT